MIMVKSVVKLNEFHNYLFEYKTRTIELELARVIFTHDGRFPRARHQLTQERTALS